MARLTATIGPEDATVQTIIWKSDNEDVAIVDKNGLVAGVNYGTTNITATTRDGGFTEQCVVTVDYHFTTPTFPLPAAIEAVEDNAFEGDVKMTVVDAHTCASIGAEAFKDCTRLLQIRLPKDCDIGAGAFSGCTKLQVYAPAGGTTAAWCEANGVLFIAE